MTFLLCDPGWCVSDVQNKWDDNTHTTPPYTDVMIIWIFYNNNRPAFFFSVYFILYCQIFYTIQYSSRNTVIPIYSIILLLYRFCLEHRFFFAFSEQMPSAFPSVPDVFLPRFLPSFFRRIGCSTPTTPRPLHRRNFCVLACDLRVQY